MKTRDELEAEIEQEKRLAKAISETVAKTIKSQLGSTGNLSQKEHEEHHDFVADLKAGRDQQKKLRSVIVEKIVGAAALGAAVFIGLALLNAVKMFLRMP